MAARPRTCWSRRGASTAPGDALRLSSAEMGFTYRHCGVPDDVIFTQALFEGTPGDPAAILAEMNAITEARSPTQPVNTRTGGSTFKNPPGAQGLELIDARRLPRACASATRRCPRCTAIS